MDMDKFEVGNMKEFENLGDYLKYVREKKGFTIDDVVNDIRIRKNYIEALEKNDYAALPERTYALGYLRSYAKFLELENVNDLVKHLDNIYHFYNPSYVGSSDVASSFVSEKHKSEDSSSRYKRDASANSKDKSFNSSRSNSGEGGIFKSKQNILFVVVIAASVVAITLWVGLIFNKGDTNEETAQQQEDEKVLADINNMVNDREFVIVEPKFDKLSPTSKAEPLNPAFNNNLESTQDDNSISTEAPTIAPVEEVESVVLTPFPKETIARAISIVFDGDVWVQIYNTKNHKVVYLDKIFKAGETYEVLGVENISIRIGNYKGLYFLVDNKKIEIKSNRRSVVVNNIILDKNTLLATYGSNN